MTKARMIHTRQSLDWFQGPYPDGLCWSSPSPSSLCSAFPLAPYKKTFACTEMERQILWQESPNFSGVQHLNKSLSFCTSTSLMSLAFMAARSVTLVLVTIDEWNRKMLKPASRNNLSQTYLPHYVPLSAIWGSKVSLRPDKTHRLPP